MKTSRLGKTCPGCMDATEEPSEGSKLRRPQKLGGGFKYVFHFHPYLWKIPSLTIIFFKWVGSTTNQKKVLYRPQWMDWVLGVGFSVE